MGNTQDVPSASVAPVQRSRGRNAVSQSVERASKTGVLSLKELKLIEVSSVSQVSWLEHLVGLGCRYLLKCSV